MIKLMMGDCIEKMKLIDDRSIDLTVTSPPYDNLRTYNDSLDWGEHVWKPVLQELFRITKQGGVVAWVVGDATVKGSETGTSFSQALWAMRCGFNLHDTMIWHKTNSIPQIYRKRYRNEFEYMFIFSKEKVKTHNPIEIDCICAGLKARNIAYKNFSKHEQKRKKTSSPAKDKKIKGNVWAFGVGGDRSGHPAVFPESLVQDLIISWSNVGDTVFDPFMGSGTTGKMALLNNRNFIGIEKDPTYFAIAENRIKAAQEPKP